MVLGRKAFLRASQARTTMGGGGIHDSSSSCDPRRIALALQAAMLRKGAAVGEIEALRDALCSYRPGDWTVDSGGWNRFAVPNMTSLLVVGPMGAGKSSLINNLIRVLNQLTFGYDRAQVCDDSGENGTLFLKEYTLSDKDKNICVYDTRGFSEVDTVEDLAMLENWVMNGVQHGQVVNRSSDSQLVNASLRIKARHGHHLISTPRQVNFVIFVVSAVSIHNMKSESSRSAADLARLFKSPFLAFKDDRPVVVMTHGDLLAEEDRVDARLYLGELFGVSPVNQIFDIAGNGVTDVCGSQDATADLAMLKMLRYAVMRADRNLPYQQSAKMLWQHLQLAVSGGCNNLGPLRSKVMALLVVCWIIALVLLIPLCLD